MFGKKMRDEKYFYDMLMNLSPKEMIEFTKAVKKFMSDVSSIATKLNDNNS